MAPALLDRMEVIRISGYTEDEKVVIAKRHLIDKQMTAHGVKEGEWSISDAALRDIIRYYTREAGVRNLERRNRQPDPQDDQGNTHGQRDGVGHHAAQSGQVRGGQAFPLRRDRRRKDLVGVTTGLAWTAMGGELLSIEALVVPGKGKMTNTGKLGDVMQESIQAAKSFVQSRAVEFGIKPTTFVKRDIHVHVP